MTVLSLHYTAAIGCPEGFERFGAFVHRQVKLTSIRSVSDCIYVCKYQLQSQLKALKGYRER